MVVGMQKIGLVLRPAIAMIELIFAIVVIGITLLSAPLVLNQSIQSSAVAIQQEAIAAAGSQISLILTQNWDESASDQANGFNILNVANGNIVLDNGVRDLNGTYSTRVFNTVVGFTDATPSVSLGKEETAAFLNDDIDDFNGEVHDLTLYAGETVGIDENKGEYIDQSITMTNIIRYGDDTGINFGNDPLVFNNPFNTSAGSTNIKLVSVQLTSTSGVEEYTKTITLSAFACNIGIPLLTIVALP